jgi:hypothetical protein
MPFIPISALSQSQIDKLNESESKIEVPKTRDELTNLYNNDYILSNKMAININIGGIVEGANSRNRDIHIKEYSIYVEDIRCTPARRYGISIRLIVEIMQAEKKAELKSLAAIAAYAELNMVTASCKFEIIGATNPKFSEIMAKISAELKVESFVTMKQAFSEIRELISSEETKVSPQLISIFVDEPAEEIDIKESSVAIVLGLQGIYRGKKYLEMHSFLKDSHKPFFIEIVKSIYDEYGLSEDQPPSGELQDRAETELKGFSLEQRTKLLQRKFL